jgi:hypothetical protein
MARLCVLLAVAWLAAGCSAQQLALQVADLSETTSKIENDQILANLSAFIDDPYRTPSHVTLGTGQASTSRSVTGSMTLPQFDFSQPSRSGTASGTLGSAMQWQMAPVIDPDDQKRLQALYQFAIYCTGEGGAPLPVCRNFAAEYPAIGYRPGSSMRDPRREVARMRERWLYWGEAARPPGAISAGTYGRHALYVMPAGFDRFRGYIRTSIFAPDPPAATGKRAGRSTGDRKASGGRSAVPPRAPLPQFVPNILPTQ